MGGLANDQTFYDVFCAPFPKHLEVWLITQFAIEICTDNDKTHCLSGKVQISYPRMGLWKKQMLVFTTFTISVLAFPHRGDQVKHTLLLGGSPVGDDDFDGYTTSIQMITEDSVCPPDIPKLPVRREMASGELLGSRVFYCGGYFSSDTPGVKSTCHSYLLDDQAVSWEEEPSMMFSRHSFGLTAVNEKLFASGGLGELDYHRSVESFTPNEGWQVEDQMQFSQYRVYHCAVDLGSWLIIIGGCVGQTPASSSSVEAFDTSLLSESNSASWWTLASMLEPRRAHACKTGEFEGQHGIFVTGGIDSANHPVNTVEFYVAETDCWRKVASMANARYYHSTTMVGGRIVVAGGGPSYQSVEVFNGSHWMEGSRLEYGVYR